MARLLLGLSALTAIGFGLFGVLDPDGTAAAVRLAAEEDFGRGELRVVYGGLWLAMGVVLALATCSAAWRPRAEGVWWCWLGLPLTRIAVLGLDDASARTLGFLAGELAMVVVLGLGLRLARGARPVAGPRAFSRPGGTRSGP